LNQLKKNFELDGRHPGKHVGPKAKNQKQQSFCRNLPERNNILLLENDQTGAKKARAARAPIIPSQSQDVDCT